jgi:hypothetical protein
LQNEAQQRIPVPLRRKRDADLVQLLDFPAGALEFLLQLSLTARACLRRTRSI